MSDESKPEEISEPKQSEDIAALKAAVKKEQEEAIAAKPVDDEAPKGGSSLADAQQQRYMNRALGRSTQTNLSRFTGNKLDALQSPSGTEDGASEAVKPESAKETFEKQRSAEAAQSLNPSNPAAGAFLLVVAVVVIGGLYLYTQPGAIIPKKVVPEAVKPAAEQKANDTARARVLVDKAQANAKAGDYKHALENFKAAKEIDSGNQAVYCEKIGECLTRLKDYKGVEAASHELLELQPGNLKGLLQHAQASYMLGNKLSARNDLFKAVEVAPGNAEVLLARGSYYASEKEYSSAAQDFKEALRLDPKIVGAKEKLTTVEKAQKVVLAAALRSKPRTAAAAPVEQEPSDLTPAQLQQLKSSDLSSLRQAGLQAMTGRKYAFAVAALERCVVINPNDAQSRKLLAYALINTKNANAAFDQFNAWASLTKVSLDDQLAFGRALRKAGDEATTIAFFNFLIDDNSTDAQNLLKIAQTADKAGNSAAVEKAVEYGLKVSSGTTKYQFTVLMRKVQTGQVNGIESQAESASQPSNKQ